MKDILKNLSLASDMYRWMYTNYMRLERTRLVINFLFLAASSLAMAALAFLVSPAIQELEGSTYTNAIFLIPIGVLILVAVNGISLYASQILTETITQNTVARIQKDVYKRFLALQLNEASTLKSGTMIAFVTGEIGRAVTGLTTLLIGFSRESMSFVFLVVVMVIRDWQLSLFVLISFPPLIAAVAITARHVRKATSEAMEAGFRLTRLSTEVLTSLRLVKIFDSIGYESNRQGDAADNRRNKAIELMRRKAVMTPINELAGGLAIAAVLTFAIIRAEIIGEFKFSDIASFLTAVFLAYRPLKRMTGAIPNFVEGMFAAERIRALGDLAIENRGDENGDNGEVATGDVVLDNLEFSYVKKKPVLRDVSLKLPAGKTVALVGPSGSGKTTLLNLIPRLYPLDGGSISIGGKDIDQMPLGMLRRSIALVSQETILVDDTVKANVIYGSDRPVDDEKVEAALKEANAWEFVSDLPNGVNSQIGERGQNLSGGQRQRLALARAIYRDAPILLLDEPTSSLDGQSEKEVREAIRRISANRSILIVAHRLPAIQFADHVYVMVDGKIVEDGSHEELNNADGVYAKIFHIQELEDKFGRQLTR